MIYCFLLWNRFGSPFCYKLYLCVLFGTIEVFRIMCLCILLPWYGLGLASLWSFQYIQSFTLFICHIKPQFSLLVWKKKQESVDKNRCENESKRIKGVWKCLICFFIQKHLELYRFHSIWKLGLWWSWCWTYRNNYLMFWSHYCTWILQKPDSIDWCRK